MPRHKNPNTFVKRKLPITCYAVALAALGLTAWLVYLSIMRPYQLQRDAVKGMKQFGAVKTKVDYSVPRWLRFVFGEEAFSNVIAFDLVRGASLRHRIVADADIIGLRQLLHIQQVRLSKSNVTDAGLDNIAELKNLEILHIDNTKISDDGVLKLRNLDTLRELALDDLVLSERLVSRLLDCRKLATLYIDVRRIEEIHSTDRARAYREADVLDSKISRLRSARSNVEVMLIISDSTVRAAPYRLFDGDQFESSLPRDIRWQK